MNVLVKDTFTRVDVPELDGCIARASDKLVTLKLQAVDHVVVTLQGVQATTRHIPNLDESIVASAHQ